MTTTQGGIMVPTKTRAAAAAIGCTIPALAAALRNGKLDPPRKDSSGDFIWTPDDIERARVVLAVDLRLKRNRTARGEAVR